MGRYLDSRIAEFDEINTGIEEILDRAADENRDVTSDEDSLIKRDQARAEELKKTIEHYSGVEASRSKVAEISQRLGTQPRQTSTTVVVERERDPDVVLLEAFPTVGDYIVTAARALRGDKAAATQIEEVMRATAHQTLADNPGIVPRPIVGPVLNAVNNGRPFISSIVNKRLPAGAFDRPKITQHVAVGVQAVEKDLTASQKLILGKIAVAAVTYAGHLNISRQDIKWTSPGIMQIVAEDFAYIYGQTTDNAAADAFVASVTNAAIGVTGDAAGITGGIFGAASASLGAGGPLPDTLWVSPDVWGSLGSLVNNNGTLVFPSVTPTSTNGNLLGLKLVVDPFFAAGTAIVGPSSRAEWYEDVDGFMSVAEPDVLGQLVGYAGFGAFVNVDPTMFNKLTITPPPPEALTASKSSK